MSYYGKINTLYKRDKAVKGAPIIEGAYVSEEVEALADLRWEATEKIDGTNMSCEYHPGDEVVIIRGKTDRASIPTHLLQRMQQIFTIEKLEDAFIKTNELGEIVAPLKVEVFGEGYGYKIQKGENYISQNCDFILFDVRVTTSAGEKLWLTRDACEDVAQTLGIAIVPLVGMMTLAEAVECVRKGFVSSIAENRDYIAEGLVLRAPHGILTRRGERLIVKIKHRDFKE